jgi:hypothetical protein
MSDIKRFGFIHHLRADSSRHVIRYRKGKPVLNGSGLAFWFQPLNTTLVEIPIDDRELQFLFHARSRDYQDVTVQGVINLRIDDPERLAERIDFSIDIRDGVYIETPVAQLASLVTELAQQFTSDYASANNTLRTNGESETPWTFSLAIASFPIQLLRKFLLPRKLVLVHSGQDPAPCHLSQPRVFRHPVRFRAAGARSVIVKNVPEFRSRSL